LTDLLTDLLVDLIDGVDGAINSAFNSLMNTCFNAEYELTHILGEQVISLENLKILIFSFSLTLIILKFLKKGFDIYILWTEGEADTPPLTFIVYFIRAIVVLLSSTILYNWLVDVVQNFGEKMLETLNVSQTMEITSTMASIAGAGLFSGIMAIIALIMLFILWVQFIIRGAEIFVLKLGFPLACVGLVNADGGVFTQYISKLFKSMLTVLVQILCCKLALLLVFSGQLIYAIAMIILAIKTPKMLQEFMLGGGGGGISNVIITASKTMELSGQISRKLKQLKKVK
jgi:hypothetical protein